MDKEKLEYFTLKPNLKQFYGVTVKEDTTFNTATDDGTVEQSLKDLTLTTVVKRKKEADDKNPFEVEEESKMVVKMPVDTILIWDDKEGFIVSNYPMTTLSGVIEEVESMKEIYKDSIV